MVQRRYGGRKVDSGTAKVGGVKAKPEGHESYS